MLPESTPKFWPNDNGPIYTETVYGEPPIIEPLNASSNIVFLFLCIYWWRRYRSSDPPYKLLLFTIPLLFVGFVGGTIYHGTRSHEVWYLLDYVPIYILCAAVAAYIWTRLIGVARGVALYAFLQGGFLVGVFILERSGQFSQSQLISLSYSSIFMNIVIPVLLHTGTRKFRHGWVLATAFGSICMALAFRQLDEAVVHVTRTGTHFLWHFFGGLATHLLVLYLWRADHVDTRVKLGRYRRRRFGKD